MALEIFVVHCFVCILFSDSVSYLSKKCCLTFSDSHLTTSVRWCQHQPNGAPIKDLLLMASKMLLHALV